MSTERDYYRSIVQLLDEDLDRMTREDLFAVYGYIVAYLELGHITPDQAVELEKRLGLTIDETEALVI